MHRVQMKNVAFQVENTLQIQQPKYCMKKIFCTCMPASLMLHYFASSIVEETNFGKASDISQLIVLKACILLQLFQIGMIRLFAKILET